MVYHFEYLLLQILMVLFPILLFHALIKRKFRTDSNKRIAFGLVCCVSIALLLLFSVEIGEGKLIDLRLVPWYLSFIYGSFNIGLGVTIFYVIVRASLGGIGMFPGFATMAVSILFIYLILKKYDRMPYRKKVLISVISLIIASTFLPVFGTVFLLDEHINSQKFTTYVLFVMVNGITVWLAVYLKESMIENEKLFLELQRSEKIKVIGHMAASVAHEIRNPMTSVRGFLQLLQNSSNLSKAQQEYIGISIDELDRANYIIRDYLSLSKEGETPDELDLNQELEYVINTLQSFAILHSTVIKYQPVQPLFIRGNKHNVRQLLINIIKNGIEATKDKGIIIIQTFSHDESVEIKISDNGEGMTKQQLASIGLAFYSTKEKGTGLGLMLCYKIVEAMNGRIKVESEQGKGTSFRIIFPRSMPSKQSTSA